MIEDFNPDRADLRLSPEAVAHWKESLPVRPDGKPRLHMEGPFLAVRAFYLDLHTWAVAEPERWAQWVAPCPIRDEDQRWFHVRRRRVQERMADRTRERQPLLPILSQHVSDQWQRQRTLLESARAVGLGKHFTVDGTEWQRVSAKIDAERPDPTTAPIGAVNRVPRIASMTAVNWVQSLVSPPVSRKDSGRPARRRPSGSWRSNRPGTGRAPGCDCHLFGPRPRAGGRARC
ncbi:hypothetical protein [Streptomyces sp. NPDC088246]|uniref:hypothetical protein n=1 Tax=Streptomyces sp. NPDC088246 TaxID=3365842 RepID=UPI0037F3DC94